MLIPSRLSSEKPPQGKKKVWGYLYLSSFPHSLEADWCDMARVIVRCSGRLGECLVPLIVPGEISSSAPPDSLSGVEPSAQMGAGFAAKTSTTSPTFFFFSTSAKKNSVVFTH